MTRILSILALLVLAGLGLWLLNSDPAPGFSDPLTTAPQDPTQHQDLRTDAQAGDPSEREAVTAPRQTPTTEPEPPSAARPDQDPSLASLTVTVSFKHNSKPAAGALIQVYRNGRPFAARRSARCNAAGVAHLANLPPGPHVAKVLRGAYRNVFLVAGQESRLAIGLEPGVDVEVLVRDPEGKPIAGADLWLSERWSRNQGQVVTQTDAEGRAALAQVSQHCKLAVRHPDHAPSGQYSLRQNPGSSQRLEITLQPGGMHLAGLVQDASGQPLPGAQILVGAEDPPYSRRRADGASDPGTPPILVRSDKTGRFVLRGLGQGEVEVQVRHPEHAPLRTRVRTTPTPSTPEILRLLPAAAVAGIVQDLDGRPLAAQVWSGNRMHFASAYAQADRGGRFRLVGLAAGPQDLTAHHQNEKTSQRLNLVAGITQEWNPIIGQKALPPGMHLLRGQVQDSQGQPLGSWRVAAQGQSEGKTKTVSIRSDAKGEFSLQVPFAEMRVWTHPPGKHQDLPALVVDDVRADAGPLLLTVLPEDLRAARVMGRVVDPEGRGLAARVELWHEDKRLWRQYSCAADGRFELRNVPPGELTLKLTHPAHPWRKLPAFSVTAGERRDLGDLRLESGARIHGRLLLPAGTQLPKDLRLLIIDEKTHQEAGVAKQAGGRYTSGPLKPGTYTLYLRAQGLAMPPKKVQLRPGGDVERNLQTVAAATCSFRFILPAGMARPRHISAMVRRPDGSLVEAMGMPGSRPLASSCSLAPGRYSLRVYSEDQGKPIRWLVQDLVIDSLQPRKFELRLQRN